LSQAGILNRASGPVPPEVATSYVTQDGTAVPLANVLIVNGFDSTENNVNGIITKGGVVGTGTSNEVDVVITNRLQGTGTTIGATTADLVTFSLGAVAGAYTFSIDTIGFDAVTPSATGFKIQGTMRTDGATATLVGVPDETVIEDVGMLSADVSMVASGNNLIIRVLGVAGLTINWNTVSLYVFIS